MSQLTEDLLGSSAAAKDDEDDDGTYEEGEKNDDDGERNDDLSRENTVLGDGLSLDFEEGALELFESGAAVHADGHVAPAAREQRWFEIALRGRAIPRKSSVRVNSMIWADCGAG